MEAHELQFYYMDGLEMGVMKTLVALGHVPPFLNRTEAYKMFGQSNVKRWISEGLITPVKDGEQSARIRLDRMELEAISKSSNRMTYLNTNER